MSSKQVKKDKGQPSSPMAAQQPPQSPTADQPATPSPPPASQLRRPATANAAADKLQRMQLQLSGINDTLQEDLRQKGHNRNSKFESVGSELLRLEQNLAVESRRRAEADSQLETEAEKVLQEACRTVEKSLDSRLDALTRNIAIVTAKVDEMTQLVATDRAATEEVLTEVRSGNANTLVEIQKELEAERSERLDNEVKTLAKIKKEMQKVSERVSLEAEVREKIGVGLNDQLAKILYTDEEEALDRLKVQLIDEVESLRNAIAIEIDARRNSEVNSASTMQLLVQQVHDSMRKLTGR